MNTFFEELEQKAKEFFEIPDAEKKEEKKHELEELIGQKVREKLDNAGQLSTGLNMGKFEGELKKKNKFDAITMLDFLEHVRNPNDSVAEANRLLKEGGLLYVNSPNHKSLLCWSIDIVGRLPIKSIRELLQKYYCIAHISIFEKKSLVNLMEQSGFSVDSVGQNSPIIERFDFPIFLKIVLRTQMLFARILRLESRVWVLARALK